jgi:hypothetical protein
MNRFPMLRKGATALFALLFFAAQACAGSLPLLGVGQAASSGGGGGFSHTFEYLSNQNSSFTATVTYPVTGSFSIGPASSDRIIVLNAMSDHGTQAAPTICGVTGTQDAIDSASQSGTWHANVTTGTTCTVVLNNGGSNFYDTAIAVWAIHGQSGGGSASPSGHTAFITSGTPEPIPVAVTIATGGFAALAGLCTSATTSTFTWTGATSNGSNLQAGGFTPVSSAADATATGTPTAATTGAVCAFGNGWFATASWGP